MPSSFKGVRYRIGRNKGNYIKETSLKLVDSGKLYLTKNKIIYAASSKAFDINKKDISYININESMLQVLKKNNKIARVVELSPVDAFCVEISLKRLGYI